MPTISGGGVYSADGATLLLTAGQFKENGNGISLAAAIAGINGTQSTGLSIGIPASPGTRHAFLAVLYTIGGGVTNLNYQVHALGSASLIALHYVQIGNSVTSIAEVTATGTNIGPVGAAATPYLQIIFGALSTNAAADTLQIDMVDTGVTNTLNKGSFIRFWSS